MSKNYYKINYIDLKESNQTGGRMEMGNPTDTLVQSHPQGYMIEDNNANEVYVDLLENNSLSLDEKKIPLGSSTKSSIGNYYFKGVWVIEIGDKYQIIDDNVLIEKLNRFDEAVDGMFTYKDKTYNFTDGTWSIMAHNKNQMKVPTFPVFYVNLFEVHHPSNK